MMSDGILQGRSILITGASAGIGRARCWRWCVPALRICNRRRGAALEELAAACQALGNPIRTLAGDLGQSAFIAALAEQAGDADILVTMPAC